MTKRQVETHANSWLHDAITSATVLAGYVAGAALGLDTSKKGLIAARDKFYETAERLDEEIEWALERAK